jgi:hypothetical protein
LRYAPLRKNSVSGSVFERHWSAEFMKHVLPRFARPHAPGMRGPLESDIGVETWLADVEEDEA